MKIFMLIAVSLFSLSTLAETKIKVTPFRPVDCKEEDRRHVNWVYELKKISESDTEAVFEFLTDYGSCRNGKRQLTRVFRPNADVVIIQDAIRFFKKEGVTREIVQHSETELKVTMTFDKEYLFKKKSEKKFAMFFYPGEILGYYQQNGIIQPVRLEFIWNILLTKEEDWIFMKIQ